MQIICIIVSVVVGVLIMLVKRLSLGLVLSVFLVGMTGKAEAMLEEMNDYDKSNSGSIAQGLPTQIDRVEIKQTDQGFTIGLNLLTGSLAEPLTRTQENLSFTDIPNAVLVLPDRKDFRQENPAPGIAYIEVKQEVNNFVRVIVAGTEKTPEVLITTSGQEVSFAVKKIDRDPVAQTPNPAEEIELTVTGDRTPSYRVPNSSTATKTDTPLRDVPQSIQVVPRQLLEDRKVRTVTEALETVSGVIDGEDQFGSPAGSRIIRGFNQSESFRNGYRDVPNRFVLSSPIGNIEQIEVVKGPASVLFGAGEPGGIINTVIKKPLSEPYYNLSFEAGNRNFFQPSIDFSGSLNADKTLLYRFNASYQSSNGFQDFVKTNQTSIAPSITWKISDKTDLNLYYEYTRFSGNPPTGYSLLLSDGSLTPRNRFVSYPDLSVLNISAQRIGYTLTHRFSDEWQIRNNFAVLLAGTKETQVYAASIANDQFASIEGYDLDYSYRNYFGQIDVTGKFMTGSIGHQVLLGFDFNSLTDTYQGLFNTNLPILDILNPNYNISRPNFDPFLQFQNQVQSYGVYAQDQITITDNLKLLIGGRYDWVSYQFEIGDFGVLGNTTNEPVRSNGAFSPRVGLVYQPSKDISLYTSYSSSFRQESGFSSATQGFEPTRGTQYEVGVKADFLDGKLSATLAGYLLTKTNVITADLNNPQFSVQTGEQQSRGIELDVAGEILPGWNIVASYANTNAEVTADNSTPVGNRLSNVPNNQASIWTTYTLQEGDLKGLGFGMGLFYVGARQGDLANSFQINDYLRTDVALFYRRDGFKAAINIRNLFDIDYASNSASGRNFIQRGAPLTITGSVGFTF